MLSEKSKGLSSTSSSVFSGRFIGVIGGIEGIMKSSLKAGVISPGSYCDNTEGPLNDFLGM